MKRLITYALAIYTMTTNSAIATEISIIKGEEIRRGEINIKDTSDSLMQTSVTNIIVNVLSKELNAVISSTYFTDGKKIINTFRDINCRDATTILTKTIVIRDGMREVLTNPNVNMAKIMYPAEINSNTVIDFKVAKHQYPTIVQSLNNICNYRP
ncbi:MAG: hypothetical protein V7K18_11715 [Nostoc sp.]|uniref:hypothetical protein n=1 Tax=Nostoc sp. TaxID=1180 RepID=UPI002FF536A0